MNSHKFELIPFKKSVMFHQTTQSKSKCISVFICPLSRSVFRKLPSCPDNKLFLSLVEAFMEIAHVLTKLLVAAFLLLLTDGSHPGTGAGGC